MILQIYSDNNHQKKYGIESYLEASSHTVRYNRNTHHLNNQQRRALGHEISVHLPRNVKHLLEVVASLESHSFYFFSTWSCEMLLGPAAELIEKCEQNAALVNMTLEPRKKLWRRAALGQPPIT